MSYMWKSVWYIRSVQSIIMVAVVMIRTMVMLLLHDKGEEKEKRGGSVLVVGSFQNGPQ